MVSMGEVRFSIVVPTYNRGSRLLDCLSTCLNQTFPESGYETIVVDDGSTDGTRAAAECFVAEHGDRARYVRHVRNLGVAAARNTGIAASRGDYVAIVADDYILPPDYLEKAERFFEGSPEACAMRCMLVPGGDDIASRAERLYFDYAVYGLFGYRHEAHGGFLRRATGTGEARTSLRASLSGAAVVRRNIFERFGPFDAALRIGEDTEYGLRLANDGIPVHINPSIRVVHAHRRGLAASARQKFGYGMGAYDFKKAAPQSPLILPDTPYNAASCLLYPLKSALARCRYAANLAEFAVLFPHMLANTSAYALGLFLGTFRGTLRDMAASPHKPR
jgi:GT2 family glycosyltransferase